jgi:hypothetical protein
MESIDEPASRYGLYVAASNVPELIAVAGGWVVDHAMAGWDVTGFIPDSHDYRDGRSLRILGVKAVKCQTRQLFEGPNTPQRLAITSDLYEQDERIRTHVARAIAFGRPEVIFLGGNPPEIWGGASKLEYQCSLAGMAFKTKALTAAGSLTLNIAGREFLFGGPSTRLSPSNCADRFLDESGVHLPPRVVSIS